MALTENISPPRPEVAFGAPLLTFATRGMGEEGVMSVLAPVLSFADKRVSKDTSVG